MTAEDLLRQAETHQWEFRYKEAERCYKAVLEIDSSNVVARINYATVLHLQGNHDDAIVALTSLLTIRPDILFARINLALIQLLTADFSSGWRNYEARTEEIVPFLPPGPILPPLHTAPELKGRNVLLHTEQGFGDAIQFIRYAQLLADRQARIVISCQPELIELFKSMPCISSAIPHGEILPPYDYQATLLSMPYICGTNLRTIPAETPYLFPPPARKEFFERRVSHDVRLKVGIAWAGSQRKNINRRRSCSFQYFAPLLTRTDIDWYSLQVGTERHPPETLNFHDLTAELATFADTAALISCLDLVVTIDTSVAHLAGALGKPAWVLLPFVPDWRWMLNREDSPWYPTIRLFRQRDDSDWEKPLGDVASALDELLRERNCHFSGYMTKAISLQEQGRSAEAIPYYRLINAFASLSPERCLNFGSALHETGRYNEALAVYTQALSLRPDFGEIHFNRGNTLLALSREEEAILAYRKAFSLMPWHTETLVTIGTSLEYLGRYDDALECYQAALARNPANAEAHWNLALALLRRGDFETGWQEFAWRWGKKGYPSRWRDFSQPIWDGAPLNGKTILIHAEQAFGDTIQFIRFLPAVIELGGEIILECPRQLIRLFSTMDCIKEIVPTDGQLPPFDCHIPLLTLPLLLHTTLETIPIRIPYLVPPADCVALWNRKVSVDSSLRIGLVWSGRDTPDPRRSCRLADLAPLGDLPGVTFFSLQIGEGAEQAACPPFDLVDLTDGIRDFADTAALIDRLDLVVSIDTSVAHLAGALGKPIFLLLPFAPDWRWMLRRNDSPWYPTMRLFRQETPGEWQQVILELCTHLASKRHRPATAPLLDLPAGYRQGMAAYERGEYQTAEELFAAALTAAPSDVQTILMQGMTLYHLGRASESEALFKRALENDTACIDAYRSIGLLLNEQGRYEEAASFLSRGIAADPSSGDLPLYLGDALQGQGNPQLALVWYRRALKLNPDNWEALLNLGVVCELLNQQHEAEAAFLRAAELDPADYRPLLNLGGVYQGLNQLDMAETYYRRVLDLQPGQGTALWNLSLLRLIRGNYPEGFSMFEARFQKSDPVRVDLFGIPPWDGSPLVGKSLLVVTEQAFGDTIQFCRYLPLLAKEGATLHLVNQLTPLHGLLQSLPGVASVIGPGEVIPPCDYAVPLLSLPLLCGTTIGTIPAVVPYLSPNAIRIDRWHKLLGKRDKLRVGVAWHGRQKPDPRRSAPLALFAPCAAFKEVSWYSLQIGEGAEEAASPPPGMDLVDLTEWIEDFEDTAALITQLDLIISIDTAVAHLAGALGKPTFLLLPFAPDWRWHLGRDDSPWYPSMRLFRQPRPNDWPHVMQELCAVLQSILTRPE